MTDASAPSGVTTSTLAAFFDRFARQIARLSGRPSSFALALSVVVLWAATGPVFGFSDTWQLIINTGTSLVTFLMVFVIQNAQNRDSEAIQIKLDELIRVSKDARDALIGAEDLDQDEIDGLRQDVPGAGPARRATEETQSPCRS